MALKISIPFSPDSITTSHSSEGAQALLCSTNCLIDGKRTWGWKGEHISAPGFLLHSLKVGGIALQAPPAHLWARKEGGRDLLYHHTLYVSTSRTLRELPWPSLLCFPLEIFSCFPNSSCQLRQPTIHNEFPQNNFVPEQHLVQEWRLQYFLGVPPSMANCRGHLGDSGMHGSNSCSSMPHACTSPLVQCHTRKRARRHY